MEFIMDLEEDEERGGGDYLFLRDRRRRRRRRDFLAVTPGKRSEKRWEVKFEEPEKI